MVKQQFLVIVLLLLIITLCTSVSNVQPAAAGGRFQKPFGSDDEQNPIGHSYASGRSGSERTKYDHSVNRRQSSLPERTFKHQQFTDGRGVQQLRSAQSNMHPLLKQASTASVCLLFGLLLWRSLSSYELADQFQNEFIRLMTIVPVVGILIANAIGFLVNLVKPLNFKTHLKVILAVNVVREWIEMAYNVFMLIASSSGAAVPREAYFGRLFMNIWWSTLCVSFSKSRWVLLQPAEPQHVQQQPQF